MFKAVSQKGFLPFFPYINILCMQTIDEKSTLLVPFQRKVDRFRV